jgi:secernin
MCDTLVALGCCTVDGNVLFAKNSDREPNEAQFVIQVPAAEHEAGSELKCTYISIPQVTHTNAIVLSKPFWIWGAEMGANEHGVVIGNEAVFTKVPQEKEPGLIGMDLLRLALERSSTAYDAMITITELLKKYGQAGQCGYEHSMVYHNSFLICDREEAWVLETAGREWAAEKVKEVRSISNAITIGSEFDLVSENLVQYAIDNKWCKSKEDFNFAKCYSDFVFTTFSDAHARQQCTMDNLRAGGKKICLEDMMAYLRSHSRSKDELDQPERGVSGASVCMHAGWGPIRVSQTTASMIAELSAVNSDTYWFTHTAAPCTSVFIPFWIGASVTSGEQPGAVYSAGSDFWEHEVLHRSLLLDYENRLSYIRNAQQELEANHISLARESQLGNTKQKEELTESMLQNVRKQREKWIEQVQQKAPAKSVFSIYQSTWKKRNRSCGIDVRIK